MVPTCQPVINRIATLSGDAVLIEPAASSSSCFVHVTRGASVDGRDTAFFKLCFHYFTSHTADTAVKK